MKIKLCNDFYITDEGTDGRKKVILNYLWIGSDDACIGTVSDAALKKLKKMVDRALRVKK